MKLYEFRHGWEPTRVQVEVQHSHNTMECILRFHPISFPKFPEGTPTHWEIRLTQVERENLISELKRVNPSPR